MNALIVTPYYAPKVGGLERYAQAMAEGLVTRGWTVAIATSGTDSSVEVINGVTVHRFKTHLTISNTPISPRWVSQLRQLIKSFSPDIINVHAPVPSLALIASAVAGKVPLVVTYHTGSMAKGSFVPDLAIGVYQRFALPPMLKKASTIITASRYVADGFLRPWRHKISIITPGVDINRFIPGDKPKVKNRLVFVGDFRDPRKGLSVLLEAMTLVPSARLRVVGPGLQTPQARVSYTGTLNGPALIKELQQATVLVLPSTTDNESFGMVLAEAMACGTAVIGSAVGGIPAVIDEGQTGLLVPPHDAAQLGAAIMKLLLDQEGTRAMGQRGREVAVNRYGWENRVDETARVFTSVIRLKQPLKSQMVHHG